MDWAALAIITLLIVAIVGFLALIVLILQYYTVTKETRSMKESIYLSKMESDYAMEQLRIQEITHSHADPTYLKDCKGVTDNQIRDAYDRMVTDLKTKEDHINELD